MPSQTPRPFDPCRELIGDIAARHVEDKRIDVKNLAAVELVRLGGRAGRLARLTLSSPDW
jgi:hypothetical protein